jgi:hypothetical protein
MAGLEADEQQVTSQPRLPEVSGLPARPARPWDRVRVAVVRLRQAALVGVLLAFAFWLGTRFAGGLPFGDGPGVRMTTWEIPTPEAPSLARARVVRSTGTPTPIPTAVPAASVATASPPSGLVDLNTAGVDEMRRVLHMRRSTAERLVAYRQRHGRFAALDDLLAVPLSRSTVERIAPLVVFR